MSTRNVKVVTVTAPSSSPRTCTTTQLAASQSVTITPTTENIVTRPLRFGIDEKRFITSALRFSVFYTPELQGLNRSLDCAAPPTRSWLVSPSRLLAPQGHTGVTWLSSSSSTTTSRSCSAHTVHSGLNDNLIYVYNGRRRIRQALSARFHPER